MPSFFPFANCSQKVAVHIRGRLNDMEHFEILSPEIGVPVVAFRLKPIVRSDGSVHRRLYDEFQIAERMRIDGWVIPAYTMPRDAEYVVRCQYIHLSIE